MGNLFNQPFQFTAMYKITSWLLLLLCVAQVTLAQGKLVKGTVTDGNTPLAGVTVAEKDNLSNSVVTDEKERSPLY
ncbi:hypothetical protein [Paraflavitalea speifideaquila]|uniref:hypothetical protein n=1 Tax=Paraflavitalea speifideaquila TaxID=3076558 RepID=UPI0028ECD6DA|nr:hypothetical protein [Paraflavitalea speifideiaquila]